jgi:hypothetical protein
MRCDNQWMSIPAAARVLGRSTQAVKRAVERGSLPAQRIPGCRDRIAAGVVSRILEAAHQPAPLRRPENSDEVPVRLVEPAGAA